MTTFPVTELIARMAEAVKQIDDYVEGMEKRISFPTSERSRR